MLISVIIPTCDRNDLLAKCLACLAPGKQVRGSIAGYEVDITTPSHFSYEVIVTDDGSAATASGLVADNYPWARWIDGPKQGAAANRNEGVRHSRGTWLVFTDDDCLPDTEFLSSFWYSAAENDVQVLEGRTLPTGQRTRVDMECPINESGGYLWSCNMAIQKNLFLELGGFDPNLGTAMEDVDLRTRLSKKGIAPTFIPMASVLHPWRPRKGFAFYKRYSESMRYFVGKHPELSDIISSRSLILNLIRRLIMHLPPIALKFRGRGLGRELLLTLYNTYALFVFARRNH